MDFKPAMKSNFQNFLNFSMMGFNFYQDITKYSPKIYSSGHQKSKCTKMDEQNLDPEKWPNLNTFATSDKTFVFFIQHIFLALTIIEDSLIQSCEWGILL